MSDPVLHLLAGPNGAGKSTLFDTIIGPVTHLEFVNADVIAARRGPKNAAAKSYEAARLAAERRSKLINALASFATETEFSHESKLDVVEAAVGTGYLVTVHVVMVPEALAVARVSSRVAVGGHVIPETKIRERYARLWPLVAAAIAIVDTAVIYDNSRARTPFRVVAALRNGVVAGEQRWPAWAPPAVRALGG